MGDLKGWGGGDETSISRERVFSLTHSLKYAGDFTLMRRRRKNPRKYETQESIAILQDDPKGVSCGAWIRSHSRCGF